MKVPPQKKLDNSTKPEGFVEILNNFMDFFFRAFNKNITIEENTPYQIKNLSFVTPSDYGSGGFGRLSVKIEPKRQIQGVVALFCSPGSISGTPTWAQVGQNIEISYIPGLAADTSYSVRLLLI